MERPISIKDKEAIKYIEYLESELQRFKSSPYKDAYLSLLNQLNNWNNQLLEKPIDLFGEATDKSFERAHKYLTEQKPYFEQLDYLRKLMTPDQVKDVDKKIVSGSSAESHIFKLKQ